MRSIRTIHPMAWVISAMGAILAFTTVRSVYEGREASFVGGAISTALCLFLVGMMVIYPPRRTD